MSEASFDLTPMIDVVMLLVVFFTMTSQFKDAMPTNVELPAEVGHEATETSPTTIFLELRRDGTLSSRGNPVRLEEVLAELPTGKSANAADRAELVLRADRMTPIGEVNRVTKAMAGAGVRRLKIITSGSGVPAGAGAVGGSP
jgi:biopolymer transport protein ExbD